MWSGGWFDSTIYGNTVRWFGSSTWGGRNTMICLSNGSLKPLWCHRCLTSIDFCGHQRLSMAARSQKYMEFHIYVSLHDNLQIMYILRLYHEGSMQPKWLIKLTKTCSLLMTFATQGSKSAGIKYGFLLGLKAQRYPHHGPIQTWSILFKVTAPLSSSKMHVPTPCFFSTLLPQRAVWGSAWHTAPQNLSSLVQWWISWVMTSLQSPG